MRNVVGVAKQVRKNICTLINFVNLFLEYWEYVLLFLSLNLFYIQY